MDAFTSRMPEDPSYWDGLAQRIAADAEPVLSRNRGADRKWWDTLARGCPALAAAASVSLVVGSFLLASTPAALDDSPYLEVAQAIGPTDQIARLLLREPAPPTVEALLPVVAGLEVDR